MTEAIQPVNRKPGIVIFVAILNFISSVFWFLGVLLGAFFLAFGQAVDLFQRTVTQINQTFTSAGVTMGMTVVSAVVLVTCLVFSIFHLFVAVGLLGGRRLAWYFQLVSCTFGLLFLPYGTILSAVILIFFFQSSVRDYFKV